MASGDAAAPGGQDAAQGCASAVPAWAVRTACARRSTTPCHQPQAAAPPGCAGPLGLCMAWQEQLASCHGDVGGASQGKSNLRTLALRKARRHACVAGRLHRWRAGHECAMAACMCPDVSGEGCEGHMMCRSRHHDEATAATWALAAALLHWHVWTAPWPRALAAGANNPRTRVAKSGRLGGNRASMDCK